MFHVPVSTSGAAFFICSSWPRAQDEIEDDLRSLRSEMSSREVYPDPAEPDRIENLNRHGFEPEP
jgi:hypothetical protein